MATANGNAKMDLIQLKINYDNTPKEVIKFNLKNELKEKGIQVKALSDWLNCSVTVAYSYTKVNYGLKPDLFCLMIIAEKLGLNVNEFFKK